MAKSGNISDSAYDRTLEQWKTIWEDGKALWQIHDVNKALKRNIHHFKLGKGADLKILVPLCGRTRDIMWLWEQGFTVVGVEASEIGVRDVFTENEINYEVSPIEGCPGVLDKSTDGKIRLYCCDFYTCPKNIEDRVQYIWDRVAFGSISEKERLKYASFIMDLMDDTCLILLEILDRNKDLDPDQRPFEFPDPEVRRHFNQQCVIKQVDQMKLDEYLDLSDERYFAYSKVYDCRIYLITKRSA